MKKKLTLEEKISTIYWKLDNNNNKNKKKNTLKKIGFTTFSVLIFWTIKKIQNFTVVLFFSKKNK